jgi:hypothetical protein
MLGLEALSRNNNTISFPVPGIFDSGRALRRCSASETSSRTTPRVHVRVFDAPMQAARLVRHLDFLPWPRRSCALDDGTPDTGQDLRRRVRHRFCRFANPRLASSRAKSSKGICASDQLLDQHYEGIGRSERAASLRSGLSIRFWGVGGHVHECVVHNRLRTLHVRGDLSKHPAKHEICETEGNPRSHPGPRQRDRVRGRWRHSRR